MLFLGLGRIRWFLLEADDIGTGYFFELLANLSRAMITTDWKLKVSRSSSNLGRSGSISVYVFTILRCTPCEILKLKEILEFRARLRGILKSRW